MNHYFIMHSIFALSGLNGAPQFVMDTAKLIKDATGWATAISAILTVLAGIIGLIQWYNADENEKPIKEKKVKRVVAGGVLVAGFAGVVTFLLSYYTH